MSASPVARAVDPARATLEPVSACPALVAPKACAPRRIFVAPVTTSATAAPPLTACPALPAAPIHPPIGIARDP